MIFVIDDDEVMAECVGRASGQDFCQFENGIEAMAALDEMATELPDLIFLDILLDGPDGFTFLDELVSYEDTVKIPVVVVSSLKMSQAELADYGVVAVLDKETMRPDDVRQLTKRYARSTT